jgi:hypothetical protein
MNALSDAARGGRTTIVKAGVEGDGPSGAARWMALTTASNTTKRLGWQADTSANHYVVVGITGQAAFNRRDRGLVGIDETDLGMPASPHEIGQREFDPRMNLLRGHARRVRRIREVHRRRIKTDRTRFIDPPRMPNLPQS